MVSSGAEVQIENGNFTRIHNEIIEQMALGKFTAYEHKCLWFLFRMTYGYRKKEDAISATQWAKGTDINRRNVQRVVDGLVKRKVIYRQDGRRGRGHSAVYGFNKYFEQWQQPEKACVDTPDKKRVTERILFEEKACVDTPEKACVDTHTKERKKDTNNTSPATLTPQQEMFGAICAAVGWDVATLAKEDKGQVAQAAGILSKAGYGASDVQRFMREVWAHDWRFEKKGQAPTLRQLRQEIGKVKKEAVIEGDVIVEVNLAPSQYYPNGHKVRQTMPRTEAMAQGYRILEEAK